MDVLSILPRRILREMFPFPAEAEELRLRAGQPPQLMMPDGEMRIVSCAPVTAEELWRITEAAAGGSLYSCESSLRRGFLSLPGGARLGVCGEVNLENGQLRSYSEISSLCLRFPHQIIGCAEDLYGLYENGFESTVIVSPPGWGKTTLLRELVRLLSFSGYRVGLADERGEVAALHRGVPQLSIGPNTDVLSGAPKAAAVMSLLRSMNPQIIALDEITQDSDCDACISCFGCGVKILATAHGESLADLRRRELYAKLVDKHVFRCCVLICRENGKRRYEAVGLD